MGLGGEPTPNKQFSRKVRGSEGEKLRLHSSENPSSPHHPGTRQPARKLIEIHSHALTDVQLKQEKKRRNGPYLPQRGSDWGGQLGPRNDHGPYGRSEPQS